MLGCYMAVRNEEQYVERAMLSAINAGVDELLVVDDASTDGTTQIVRNIAASHATIVRVVRYDEKTECHQRALFKHVAEMRSSWVIGMGADDALCRDGVREFKRLMADGQASLARAWFGNYNHVVLPSGRAIAESRVPVPVPDHAKVDTAWMSDSAFASFVLNRNFFRESRLGAMSCHECGVGSFVRKDDLLWLYQEQQAWRMGPWSDSIGLAAMCLQGGLGGCVGYIQSLTAEFTVARDDGRQSHHQRVMADHREVSKCRQEAIAFLGRMDVAADDATKIMAKWGL